MNPIVPRKEFQKLQEAKIVADFFASEAWAKVKIYALAEMASGLPYGAVPTADNNARLDGARMMLNVLEVVCVPEAAPEPIKALKPV